MHHNTSGLAGILMLTAVSAICAGPAAPSASAQLGTRRSQVADRITVYPTRVDLHSRRDTRQLVVTGYFGSELRDLTQSAHIKFAKPGIASADPGLAVIKAKSDGETTLQIEASGKMTTLPVHVTGSTTPDPVQFKFETMAVLTKQGCSTGSCHGSPHGKGGFQLSLFGYDPNADRIALTRDGFNRRIDVMEPADSLIIKKPMLQLPHIGGKRLHRDDAAFKILSEWISEGAGVELAAADCTGISVYPKREITLSPGNASQQFSVIASFSDGSTRDVTAIAAYDSSSAASISVNPSGLATGKTRGQAAISVRYLDKLESVHVTMVEPVPGFDQVWKTPAEANYIDTLVDAKLKQLQYAPAPVCSDSVFLRRVYLDLTGLLPGSEAARAFLADKSPNKRSALVDALLNTEEYARFWALQRADLMRVTPARLKGDRAQKFSEWIVDALRTNMGYDRFAREIITASGDTEKSPAACYFVAIPTMEERTEMTAELFMGSRVECAHCHNHPFENWTQKDYYSIGAVFARTQATDGMVKLASSGEANHPITGEVMAPFGAPRDARLDPSEDRRQLFADWLVKPGNPFFARVAVNRIWAALMGKGIVDPIDDLRSSNPPSNGPLLERLAREFEASGYDCKQMIRQICRSNTYQRSGVTTRFNETDQSLFSHALVRPLTAEQVKDSLAVVAHSLPALPQDRGRYATERSFPENSAFTASFGQPERLTSCACERQSGPTLIQALELLNGPLAYGMAQSSAGYYAAMPDAKLLDELYMAAFSREPTQRERSIALAYLAKPGDRSSRVTDLVWTVLNTREFLFQH